MLSVVILVPLVGAAAVAGLPWVSDRAARVVWLAISSADLALLVGMWVAVPLDDPGTGLAWEERIAWIPSVGTSYHVGVAPAHTAP